MEVLYLNANHELKTVEAVFNNQLQNFRICIDEPNFIISLLDEGVKATSTVLSQKEQYFCLTDNVNLCFINARDYGYAGREIIMNVADISQINEVLDIVRIPANLADFVSDFNYYADWEGVPLEELPTVQPTLQMYSEYDFGTLNWSTFGRELWLDAEKQIHVANGYIHNMMNNQGIKVVDGFSTPHGGEPYSV